MGTLHRDLLKETEKATLRFYERHIEKKLKEAGVRKRQGLAKRIFDHFMTDSEEPFLFDDGSGESVELVFDDGDHQVVGDQIKIFLDAMPAQMSQFARDSAAGLYEHLKAGWPKRDAYEQRQASAFRGRLQNRWGEAFGLFRMLVQITREIGAEEVARFGRSRSKKNRLVRSLIFSLHARGCQVATEVLLLMEAGHADGANARWRTLHEIEVTATLLAENGDAAAQRYADYDAVEADKALREYDLCHAALGMKPYPKRDRAAIQKRLEAVCTKYGKSFKDENGWAVPYVKGRPTFRAMEEAANRSAKRSHYKMASYSVHAGVRGVNFTLATMDGRNLGLAGASNIGFEEPGSNTARTLVLLTHLLMAERSTFDEALQGYVLVYLRDEVEAEFVKAAHQIEREEKAEKR